MSLQTQFSRLSLFNQSNAKRMSKKQKGFKVGRDARTGEFIPVKEAERREKTAVVETIKRKR